MFVGATSGRPFIDKEIDKEKRGCTRLCGRPVVAPTERQNHFFCEVLLSFTKQIYHAQSVYRFAQQYVANPAWDLCLCFAAFVHDV